jgi:uncharacterized protein YndB with AHSA1/START domain
MPPVMIADQIRVDAPAAQVWDAISDPIAHARWHPFVSRIAGKHRLGQVRTCSVQVGGKTGETRERCVIEEPPVRIAWLVEEDSTGFGRMVSDWRSGFSIATHDGATVVTAESEFKPRVLLVRVMLPLIRRKFHQTQRAILAGLRHALESSA